MMDFKSLSERLNLYSNRVYSRSFIIGVFFLVFGILIKSFDAIGLGIFSFYVSIITCSAMIYLEFTGRITFLNRMAVPSSLAIISISAYAICQFSYAKDGALADFFLICMVGSLINLLRVIAF